MKFFLILNLLVILSSTQIFAQYFPDPYRDPQENTVLGGLGMTWIDGQPFTTITLAPEFSFGQVGVGLNLQLLYDNNGDFKLRKDEFEDGPGFLRVIRYIRVGQKFEEYYVRVGALDRAILGNGFLMWNYNNGSNYDKRRIGLAADVDFGFAGFETVWSSVGTSTVRGVNLYMRPFRLLDDQNPIFRRFRVYANLVRDNDITDFSAQDSSRTLTAIGIGADLQWLDLAPLKSTLYADYAEFNDFGSGTALGINFVFPEFIGLMAVAVKFEKRFLNDQFVPSLFGPLYELQREIGVINSLQNATANEGYFGELAGHIVNRVRLVGSFQKLNGVDKSGILHLEASAPNLIPSIELRAWYDKLNIENFDDVTTLDINSVAAAEVGIQLNSFLLLSTIYRWYWVEDPNNPGFFKPVERVEPRLSFRYRF